MRFRKNPRFEMQARNTQEYRAAMTKVAFTVAQSVRTVALGFRETGHYQRSIGNKGNVVYSTDIAAHIIEFGGAHTPAYGPLRRGVRAAGLRFTPLPKQ